jgi:hypothetical protein
MYRLQRLWEPDTVKISSFYITTFFSASGSHTTVILASTRKQAISFTKNRTTTSD